MKTVPLFDLAAHYAANKEPIDAAMAGILQSGAFIGGPAVSEFEAAFAQYLGVDEVISCANGTDALEIALRSLGLGPSDEVVVPAMTWISTAEAVATVGATPIFADVEPTTGNLDPEAAERAVTARTRAIIAVHLYGRPARLDRIGGIAQRHDLLLIEDCAQAHGAEIGGRKVGSFGDAAIFSFFPTKNLGCFGDGGAMLLRDTEAARLARLIRNHGQSKRHEHLLLGRNSRLDTLQAAILSAKLPRLDSWIERKAGIAAAYRAAFANLPMRLPEPFEDGRHGWHLFVIRVPGRRDALRAFLDSRGIATGIHYPTALPLQPCFSGTDRRRAEFPAAVEMQEEIVSLPLYPELKDEQVEQVISAVRGFFS